MQILSFLNPLFHVTLPSALSCNRVIKVILKKKRERERWLAGRRGRWRELWSHYKVITEKERSGGCYNSYKILKRLRETGNERERGGAIKYQRKRRW